MQLGKQWETFCVAAFKTSGFFYQNGKVSWGEANDSEGRVGGSAESARAAWILVSCLALMLLLLPKCAKLSGETGRKGFHEKGLAFCRADVETPPARVQSNGEGELLCPGASRNLRTETWTSNVPPSTRIRILLLSSSRTPTSPLTSTPTWPGGWTTRGSRPLQVRIRARGTMGPENRTRIESQMVRAGPDRG